MPRFIWVLPLSLALAACGGDPTGPLRSDATPAERAAAERDCLFAAGVPAGVAPSGAQSRSVSDCMVGKGFL